MLSKLYILYNFLMKHKQNNHRSKKLTSDDGKFFIVGLRRSGTSIFRNMVLKSPNVREIMFEPHELLQAAQLLKIPRYKGSKYHMGVVQKFKNLPKNSGAKFALNPGIDAIEWVWLHKIFPQAKFVFITRNVQSNWKSYKKADAKTLRGIIPSDIYKPFHKFMNDTFTRFSSDNPNITASVDYDKLLTDVNGELQKVWKLLKVKSPGCLKHMIRKPVN